MTWRGAIPCRDISSTFSSSNNRSKISGVDKLSDDHYICSGIVVQRTVAVKDTFMKTDWLILADHAEVVGNKLYLHGGGWDQLTVNSKFPLMHPCAIAAAFRVEWNETNQRHNVELEFRNADGVSVVKMGAQIEVGRPAGIPPGQSQRAQIAGNLPLPIEKPGTYEVIARIEGQESDRIHFNVIQGPLLTLHDQQQGLPGAELAP